MKKALRLVTVLALATGTSLAGVTPAQAAPAIQLRTIQYDPSGSDTPITNAKLNREWVQVKNTSKKMVKLEGWTLSDRHSHVYRFPPTNLSAGKTITVYTGKGTNSPSRRYWGQKNYIWNNTGDRATLRKKNGTIVDRCSWGDGSGKINC